MSAPPKRYRDLPRSNRNLVAEYGVREAARLPGASAKPDSSQWKEIHGNKENVEASSKFQLALMAFDTCKKLGPKIGLGRLDRLARADALDIPVNPTARTLIESDDGIGQYVYSEVPPRYG